MNTAAPSPSTCHRVHSASECSIKIAPFMEGWSWSELGVFGSLKPELAEKKPGAEATPKNIIAGLAKIVWLHPRFLQ